jgi:aryl-alcohol dehydrogenase-like predicted oxidoreductase
MQTRKIAGHSVSQIGLGCMNMSSGYGPGPEEAYSVRLLNEALDIGYSFMDTAAVYGFGKNEKLVGKAIGHRRDEYFLASKCGLWFNEELGKREINGRPEIIKKTCEQALGRLGVDVIDLYYLHRKDPNVPMEDSIGAMSELVAEGKIRYLGLSEVSGEQVHQAHKVHPISAVQSEYSLWTRNPEIAVLKACEDIGAAFVAFSPVGRKFLTGTLLDVDHFDPNDLRATMPRFSVENYEKNLELLEEYANLAKETGCTMAQLCMAWLLQKGANILPIPGTTSIEHMRENAGASDIVVSDDVMACLEALINEKTVHGGRYNDAAQKTVYTEDFV